MEHPGNYGSSAPDAPLPRSERFEIVRCLGRGGMGVVYEALDRERGGHVALKTIRDMDAEALLLFKHEFRALQDLHHRNLVGLGELVEEAGTWFFTMELVSGTDFLSYVRTGGSFRNVAATPGLRQNAMEVGSAETMAGSNEAMSFDSMSGATVLAASVPMPMPTPTPTSTAHAFDEHRLREGLRQLAVGLLALHDARKVHRDIKPANIMVADDGRVVLLDFGLVADVSRRAFDEDVLVGTIQYMSPEQAASKPPDAAADWYSVGVILYEALTGRLPFVGSPMDVLRRKIEEDPVPPAQHTAGLPEDLERLCTDLLARDPGARPTGLQIMERLERRRSRRVPRFAVGSAASGTFVGRAQELTVLRDALETARAGTAIAVLVHGESGVGKSALVRQFLDETAARRDKMIVLAGRCYERETVPYKAFDGVVDELSQFLLRDPDAASFVPPRVDLLTQIFPVLKRVPSIAWARSEQVALDPHELRKRAFAAMRGLLSRIAAKRPLVIAIDDLQWADSDSLVLMTEVLSFDDAPSVLLVATVREGIEGELLGVDALADRIPIRKQKVLIESLSHPDAVTLASILLTSIGGDNISAETIARETLGHPMFICELVRHSREELTDRNVPLQIDAALWSRIEKLDSPARELIELVATGGLPIPQEVAAHALGSTLHDLGHRLTPLRTENLVRSTGVRASDLLEPYHDRVREAVVQRLTPASLADYHRRLANGLLATGHSDPERLAAHFQGAGALAEAAQAYAAAAKRAEEAFAFERAARLYQLAIDLSSPADPGLRLLKMRLADALANAGHGADAARDYLAAAAGASASEALDLRLRAAEQLLRSGRVNEGLELVGSILSDIDLKVPTTPKRALLSLLMTRTRVRLRGLGFKERPESEISASELRRVDACWSVALSLGHVDPIRGADVQARHLLLALKSGEPYRIARSFGAEAIFVATTGIKTRQRVVQLVEKADELSRRVGDPHAIAMTEMAKGLAAYFVGEWPAALAGCERAETIYREKCVGVMRERVTAQLFTLWSLSYLGQLVEMQRRQRGWLHEAEVRSDRYAATTMRLGFMNMAWLAEDDVDGARREIKDAMGPWSHEGGMQYMDNLIALGHIDLYTGDAEAAKQRIMKAWKVLVRALLLTVQVSRVEMLHLRGRSLLAVGACDEAARDARKIKGENTAWSTPLGELLHAGVHAAQNNQEACLASLDLAIAGFDAASMSLYAAVARRRRGVLVGGAEGQALVEAADLRLAEQGVKQPPRMAAMLAPGFVG